MLFSMLSLPRARSLALCRSDRAFGFALGIEAAPEAIWHARFGCTEAMERAEIL